MAHVGDAPIDRYVVLEHLSEGGMGAIYVGKKLGAGGFEMEVVLKQLLPEFTQQEEFIDLFLREAKLSATLDHANIVHTIDLVTAGNEYFIVMEYLPGGDLRTLLKKAKRRGKRFSPAAAVYIAREVLSALAYAHAKRDLDGKPLKLIHRDVSPSNILLSYGGEVKLTDFGIAKAATHTSLFYKVKGKIGYMSPEQAKSEPMDHRSDLYSLAVCLYEVLTGERLFVHAGLTTSADEIYSQPVPQISRKVPGIPHELDSIMSRALSISPALRFQTASELQEALMRCAHRNGLLMSAPELAAELREACGTIDQWRGDDDDDDLGYVQRGGTEVYDAGDDDEVDYDLDSDRSEPMSIHSMAAKLSAPPRAPKPSPPDSGSVPKVTQPRVSTTRMPMNRPKTQIERFAGIEMTSIINMFDPDANPAGAKPLVDLDLRPVLDQAGIDPIGIPETPRTAGAADESTARGLPPPPPRLLPPMRSKNPSQPPPRLDELFPNPRAKAPSQPPPAGARAPLDKLPVTPLPQATTVKPWMIIATILLAAGIIAILVALSGPNVSSGK